MAATESRESAASTSGEIRFTTTPRAGAVRDGENAATHSVAGHSASVDRRLDRAASERSTSKRPVATQKGASNIAIIRAGAKSADRASMPT